MWLAEGFVQPNAVVAIYKTDAQSRWDEVFSLALLLLLDVFAVNDVRDMPSNGRVCTDAVLVHQIDEIRLSKVVRRCCLAFSKLADRRHKLLAVLKVRHMRALPAVVDIDIKVVALEHDETRSRKLFAGYVNVDGCLHACRISGTAGQEATSDEVIDALVIACEIGNMRRRMDWRMRFIVLLAVARSFKSAVDQTAIRQV